MLTIELNAKNCGSLCARVILGIDTSDAHNDSSANIQENGAHSDELEVPNSDYPVHLRGEADPNYFQEYCAAMRMPAFYYTQAHAFFKDSKLLKWVE